MGFGATSSLTGPFNEGLFNERLGLSRPRTTLPLGRPPVRWLLSLLQLLCLLLVLLLHLLFLRVIRLLFIQIHVLLVLPLLELVSFLLLLRDLFLLLLLVLLVQLRIARIWSARRQGRKVVRMNGGRDGRSILA